MVVAGPLSRCHSLLKDKVVIVGCCVRRISRIAQSGALKGEQLERIA
jgi:hypothetical protein